MELNSGDTAFVLISAALVMLMTPGLALFYGGMVRNKNVLGTIMQSFILLGVITIEWVLIGYSMSFSGGGSIIGNLDWFALKDVGMAVNPDIAKGIPHLSFMIFQCMFAIITPALITGAFAERMKFSAFLLFTLLWAILVYNPLCHWVWGGGWLGSNGLKALDFAGGTVVHISSGSAALIAALMIGKRKGYGNTAYIPHNLPMTITGAALLWFGWFGFNAGSALACNGSAANAFVVTHISSAVAAFTWILAEWIHSGKPTTLGAASGAVAGLVAITPACGFINPVAAIIIGAVAGVLCYGGIMLKTKLGYDDSLDVVGIHGIGGMWGALATGLFAIKSIGGTNGLFFKEPGDPNQLWIQFISVVATIAFSFIMTFIILLIVKAITGLRVNTEDEERGLDISMHNETGYTT